MRLALVLVLLPLPAHAWTFTPGPVCLLEHETGTARIMLTYDPGAPLYTVTVATDTSLPDAPVFSMRFIGPSGQTISTTRHAVNSDRTEVTVTDTGFGNVLDGLQFNTIARAILGDTTIDFPLDGAAQPVAKFRACEVTAGA